MRLELAGKRFSRLLVIKRVKIEGANNAMWECRCDCGNTTIAAASNISSGVTNSCGCLAKEKAAESLRGNTINRTHNMTTSVEYRAWSKLKMRCYVKTNPKYPHYGARGITVCDHWRDSFENFLEDMGLRPSPKHSIDREDVNGNYEKSNCRWATATQQMRNTTRNVFVEINGETKCMSEWCEYLGISKVKPYELCRGSGRDRKGPPQFTTPEDALRHLHAKYAEA